MSHLSFISPRFQLMRLATAMVLSLCLAACGSVRYYAQAIHGQGELMVHQRAISAVVRDAKTSPQLAARLLLAQRARQFASQQLGLPSNRSYTSYVDLHRPYVVWNVFAAPRYSVDAVPQCFPFVGCVAYRGYFKHASAIADAARLRHAGDDVWVGGVPAYSTLGWFADPIVSSMLRWDNDELASTIFHELAHQLIYVKGDTAFNESFASFVQAEGLREWRSSQGLPDKPDDAQVMDAGFTQLVLDLRSRLKALYASGTDAAAMKVRKQTEIEAFRVRYHQWQRKEWPQDHRYDTWIAQPINNARLLPFGLYDQWIPALTRLFRDAGGDWPAFYASVRALAKRPETQRTQALQRLLNSAP
ncbi:MAG: aminopeptidase [Rhodanobacter sp.]